MTKEKKKFYGDIYEEGMLDFLTVNNKKMLGALANNVFINLTDQLKNREVSFIDEVLKSATEIKDVETKEVIYYMISKKELEKLKDKMEHGKM